LTIKQPLLVNEKARIRLTAGDKKRKKFNQFNKCD